MDGNNEEEFRIAICDVDDSLSSIVADWVRKGLYQIDVHNYSVMLFNAVEDALSNDGSYDVIFMDLDIDDKKWGKVSSIAASHFRKRNSEVLIVAITNKRDYLDVCMDNHFFRFIEKPLVHETIDRILKESYLRTRCNEVTLFDKDIGTEVQVKATSIVLVCVDGRGTKIVVGDKEIRSKIKILSLKEQLPDTIFAFAQRSFLVNLLFVNGITEDNELLLPIRETVVLSRNYAKTFKKKYGEICKGAL